MRRPEGLCGHTVEGDGWRGGSCTGSTSPRKTRSFFLSSVEIQGCGSTVTVGLTLLITEHHSVMICASCPCPRALFTFLFCNRLIFNQPINFYSKAALKLQRHRKCLSGRRRKRERKWYEEAFSALCMLFLVSSFRPQLVNHLLQLH